MNNVILQEYTTPFQSIPFSKIKEDEFLPAFTMAIEDARANILKIINNIESPNFSNTYEALENSSEKLAKVSHILFNLNSADTNENIQKITQEVSPLLSEFRSYINLNEKLFNKLKWVYDNLDRDTLNNEQITLLEKTYTSFLRNGIALKEKKEKERLQEIDKELSRLSLIFGENLLKETQLYYKHITDLEVLKGLPESDLETAQTEAKKRNLEGWVFTLQAPSYLAIMKYAENRELRKDIFLANGSKAYKNTNNDNSHVIESIIRLRKERANLLGFSSHAEYVLSERMAKTPTKVLEFLHSIKEKAKPFAKIEIEALKKLSKNDGIDDLQAYDHSYYAEKHKQNIFNFTEDEIKPYFELNSVINAAFGLAFTLYNFEFKQRNDIEVYNEEVLVFEVIENNKHKALLYIDLHPRDGKRAGAWMTTFQDQGIYHSNNIRPHVSIVCNFTRPTENQPSLLNFNEVTTFFHELGHALHMINAETQYKSLSGTHVLWDFVELPSQFMENYCYEAEFLSSFAKHYKTQEGLPKNVLENLVSSNNFMEGYQTLRQVSFGLLDMAYHTIDIIEEEFDPGVFERNELKDVQLYSTFEEICFSTSFSHIFAGGYSAAYYSYKWAEVLDADAFYFFKEKGIFDKETASKFKTLLAKGGTEDPMKLYIDFRGKEPSIDALLHRAGLIQKTIT